MGGVLLGGIAALFDEVALIDGAVALSDDIALLDDIALIDGAVILFDDIEALLSGATTLPDTTLTLSPEAEEPLTVSPTREHSSPLSSLENKRHKPYSVGDMSTTHSSQIQPLRIKKMSENQLRYDSLN